MKYRKMVGKCALNPCLGDSRKQKGPQLIAFLPPKRILISCPFTIALAQSLKISSLTPKWAATHLCLFPSDREKQDYVKRMVFLKIY